MLPTRMGTRGGKSSSLVKALSVSVSRPTQIRRGEKIPRKHLVDVGKVHLETVFVLVDVLRHVLEPTRLVKLFRKCCIDFEIPEWRSISCTFGKSAFGQVEVMRGPKDEDSLTVGKRDVSDSWVRYQKEEK